MIIIINILNWSILDHQCSEIIKIISHSIAIQTFLINIKRKKVLFHKEINIIRLLNPPNNRMQREVPPNNQSLAIGRKLWGNYKKMDWKPNVNKSAIII